MLLSIGAWAGWRAWQAHTQAQSRELARVAQLESRVSALQRDVRAQSQRIRQADAVNRVLRDDLLGVGQRAALLEDSVHKLADPQRHGAQALRLDEIELLLSQGMQRLSLSADLGGARHAYALASGLLDGIDDPAYLDLRQTLAQERAALDALGVDPAMRAAAGVDAFAARLPAPDGVRAAGSAAGLPWWRRAFGHLLVVRADDDGSALGAPAREAALAALRLELALARSAIERRDTAAYRAALDRAAGWLPRLWHEGAQRRALLDALRTLRGLPLRAALPVSGTTLQQLRALRASP